MSPNCTPETVPFLTVHRLFVLPPVRHDLLRQSSQDSVNFFGDGCQNEFKLLLGAHSLGALVAQVFQGGSNVDFTGSFGHAVQDHVDQTVRSAATSAVAKEIKEDIRRPFFMFSDV